MRAFEIYLNDQKLCLAGIGDNGVLSAIVTCVMNPTNKSMFVDMGGLISPKGQHVSWIRQLPVAVGDKIQVNVVEEDSVDEPERRDRTNAATEIHAKENYVRKMAKQLGWRLVVPRTKPSSRSQKKR